MWIANAAQFIKHFGKYGEITDSVIMKDRNTGQPRGFGFVTYADASVVDRVIEDTHIINGKQVSSLIIFQILVHDFYGHIELFVMWTCFLLFSYVTIFELSR